MRFEAECKTTAMGIMPHRDIDEALELALSLDIPYWPQLPRISPFQETFTLRRRWVGQIAAQSLLAPARCNIKELGQDRAAQFTEEGRPPNFEEGNVARGFAYLRELSGILKDRYGF